MIDDSDLRESLKDVEVENALRALRKANGPVYRIENPRRVHDAIFYLNAVPVEELKSLADEWEEDSEMLKVQGHFVAEEWTKKYSEELQEVIADYE